MKSSRKKIEKVLDIKMKPKFIHDCHACKWLGRFTSFDLYVCPDSKPMGPSYIARYGSEGSQYASYPESVLLRLVDEMNTRAFDPGNASRACVEAYKRHQKQEQQ